MVVRVRIIQAFGFLLEETCVILYWLGLWSLLNLTPLLDSVIFDFLCVVGGAIGLFVVKAFAPVLIMQSAEETVYTLEDMAPTVRNINRSVRFVRDHAPWHGPKEVR